MSIIRHLLFFAFTVSASAQQNESTPREVHLRLLAFDATTVAPDSYMFDPAARVPVAGLIAPIKGYLNHEGISLQLFGNDIVFSKSMKAEDAKKVEMQIGKVTLPNSGKHFMLIFLPGANQTSRILPLGDSTKEFPLGAYRVVSLSRLPVKLTLEDKAYEFKPGQSSVISDVRVNENHHSVMYAYCERDGKWQRIGSSLWPGLGKKRSVQVFFDNPMSKQTELRGFRDVSPPVPGTESAPTTANVP